MQLKGRQRDIGSIARDLNVRYVLDGSVRKAGTRLRIMAQLVDAPADTQVWTGKYNGTLDDVFEIQEQVSRAIVAELEAKLTDDERRALARRPIPDVRAYECYLRARAETQRFTAEGLARALRELEHALQLVGDNALLLAALGEAHWQQFNLGVVTDAAHLATVEAIADRIERLEPGASHGYRLRALVALHRGDMQAATRLVKRAVAIDPNDPFTLVIYICGCGLGGRSAAAADAARRLVQIDPLQPMSHLMAAWSQHYLLGEFDAALESYRRAYDMDPNTPMTVLFYATGLAALRRVDVVHEIVERLEVSRPADRWTWLCQTLNWALRGDAAAVGRTLTPDLRQWCSTDPQYALHLAEVHSLVGDCDEAFWWLDRMLDVGACPYPFVASTDPFLAAVRRDARWPTFVARLRAAWERFEA
jgi:non-specific serine/threonine protein kinase